MSSVRDRKIFDEVSWQNLKSGICLIDTFEHNHHSALTDELVSAWHICDLALSIASLRGRFTKPVSVCLAVCRLAHERALLLEGESLQGTVDTQSDFNDAVTHY